MSGFVVLVPIQYLHLSIVGGVSPDPVGRSEGLCLSLLDHLAFLLALC